MADPESVVRSLFEDTAKPGNLIGALETHVADQCVWENTGFPTANGIGEIKGFMQQFIDGFNMHALIVEYKAIAASGNTVITERIDSFEDADCNRLALSVPVAGTLEVEGDKIVQWRDYFDPRPFLGES